METSQSLNLESDDVQAHLKFLLSRATVHDEDESDEKRLHRLCAATLRRDAAALAIILGKFDDARTLLLLAGSQFLAEQSFYGLALLSLVKTSLPWEQLSQRTRILSRRFFREQKVSEEFEPESRADVSRMEGVAALQALSVLPERDPSKEELWQQLIAEFKVSPVRTGASELRTPFYFGALESLASGSKFISGDQLDSDVSALLRIRESELQAAQSDKYNWSMLLNPSDVVGFDMMFIGLSALRRGQSLDSIVKRFGGVESPLALPFRAVMFLASSQQ
jgi:hypothetical protein